MRLALLGYPVSHSLSPSLYRELLKEELESYELLEVKSPEDVPALAVLSKKIDGLSITSPYKKHFFSDVQINSKIVNEIGAINTIAFRKDGFYGTNTDVIAVEKILTNYRQQYADLHLIILGDGVMGRVTKLVAEDLSLSFEQYSRKKGHDLQNLDFSKPSQSQTIIINSCSREFVFKGKLNTNLIFWDYNYSFLPHSSSIPQLVKSYIDGQEMLRLQAESAIDFWKQTSCYTKC